MKSHPYMKKIFVFLIAITIFSCEKDKIKKDDPDIVTPGNFAEAKTELNKIYGNDDNAAQVMDIYLPANRSTATTKVFLLVHGGAWLDGDKNGTEDDQYIVHLLDSLKKKFPDWAIFNMNYRLAKTDGSNIYPTQENDMIKAVKYIYDNRAAFGISDKWVYVGMSAGAQMALVQAYKQTGPIRPKAVIDFYGPTDMTALYNTGDGLIRQGLRIFLGGTPSSKPGAYSESSPITHVDASDPPTLILHGGGDDTVPESQSFALRDKLASLNVRVTYVAGLKEQGHGWSSWDSWATSINAIQNFVNTNVP